MTRELMLVAILSRIWPSHRCLPRRKQKNLPEMVCVHSPAGILMWRISEQEAPLFEHLALSENHADHYRAGDKEALLLLLASSGF
jgi:hypothetical protein